MDLISCGGCGVVLDKNKLKFPDVWDKEGERIESSSVYDCYTDELVSFVSCPVCNDKIQKNS